MQAKVNIYDVEVYPNCFMVTVRQKGETKGSGKLWTWTIYEGDSRDKALETLLQIVLYFNDKSKWFVGYNNFHYDDQILNYIIAHVERLLTLSPLGICREIKEHSDKIIKEDNRDHKYDRRFGSIDLLRIIQVGANTKALKLVAVNLKESLIQDLPYPDTKYIEPEEVPLLERYNVNDVNITESGYYHLQKDINTRSQISHLYGVNVMSESNSGIGNVLFERLYAEATGLHPRDFKYLRSEKEGVHFEHLIAPNIKFRTAPLRVFLEKMKGTSIHRTEEWEAEVEVGNTIYTIAKGGIHSNNTPGIYSQDEEHYLFDLDVSSYYPRIVVNYQIYPEHLSPTFCTLMERIMEERVSCKKSDPVKAAALKIAINGAFGKFGFEHHWLYDPEAMYAVTLNGQLALLMLIERLEEEGFEVFYANTDGITVRVPRNNTQRFAQIAQAWSKFTKFELEAASFERFILRDVNNYLVIKDGPPEDEFLKTALVWDSKKGDIKRKGALHKKQYSEDLMKSFKYPVVPHAIEEYFVNGIPVSDTINAHTDPYDFCMAQKVSEKFKGVYFKTSKGTTKLQKTNRYFVATKGGLLFKVKKGTGKPTALLAKHLVMLANDMEDLKKRFPDGLPIKRRYYIEEAQKIVDLIEGKKRSRVKDPDQLPLF